jgi:hypothetical protein
MDSNAKVVEQQQDEEDYFSQLAAGGEPNPPTATPANNVRTVAQINEDYKREREERERTLQEQDDALPFSQRTLYRKRHMYRGWQLEPVEEATEGYEGMSGFAITRSNYGYRVLNSPDLGAVDVDFDLGPGICETHIAAQQKESLSNIRDWVAAHPEQSWRVYRTAGGMRMIRTDAPQPLDETYVAVAKAIEQSDRLYSRLCKEQKAFRLRISPKVARIGADYPGWSPYAYPEGFWDHAPTPEEIRAYDTLARQYKVADLMEVVGSGQVHPALVAVLKHHDESCRVESSRPMETPSASECVVYASIPELIAFNDVYRPNGMAPGQIWDNLDGDVQRALRELDGNSYRPHDDEDSVVIGCSRSEVLTSRCKYLDALFLKWNPEDAENYKTYEVLYAAALEKYKEDAKQFIWIPNPGEITGGWPTGGHWQSSEDLLGSFSDDPRYWRLRAATATTETPTASAIIRFLPSADGQRLVQQKTKGFLTYNLCNILVIKDPAQPENEGKVFLFRFGSSVKWKIHDLEAPPPEFTEMEPVDVFDLKTGCNFKLRAVQIDDDLNLDRSTFDSPCPVGDDAFIADLRRKVYSLSLEQSSSL